MQPENTQEEEKITVTYKDTFRFLWSYTKNKKSSVVGMIAFVMLANFAMALTPIYAGKIIDAMVGNADNAWDEIWWAFWLLMGLRAAQHVCYTIAYYFDINLLINSMNRIINDASYKVQRFNSEWHVNSFGGSTVRKITRGQWSFHDVMETSIMEIIPTIFLIIGIVAMLSLKIPIVGLAMGVMVVFYIVFNIYMAVRIMSPMFKKSVEKDNKISAVLGDIITANQVVKSFGAEKREDESVGSAVDIWRKYTMFAWYKAVSLGCVRHILNVSMVALVVSLVIWAWKSGNATPGDIAVVIAATSILSGHITNIGRVIERLQKSFNELEDVVAIWLRKDDVCDIEDAMPLVMRDDCERSKIAFEDVGFIYPQSDVGLFKNLSLKIKAGEHVALVGTSGSGKSSFIKLLQRLYNINEGQIRVDGQDISKVTLESLRQTISIVPQDPILFHRSLKENIAYGKSDATMEEIVEASKKAHIYDFITTLPEGYNTEVGERGIKLSGGERQRVAIARAILADKPILVLDEATSSLDSVSELHIKEAMEELMKGKTTVTVAHRLSTVRNSDRILVFSRGKIIEQGKHDELIANLNSKYKKLYDTQSLGIVIRDETNDKK